MFGVLKALRFLAFFVLGAAALLYFSKDWMVKGAFESAVERLTGFETKVRTLGIDLGKGEVHLEGLTLLNPEGFEERIFADVLEIHLQMDLPTLLKKEKTHLRELRLDIRELNLEKNRNGVSNVSRLTSVKKSSQKSVRPSGPAAPKKSVPFQLDRLDLTLRRVRYQDRSGIVPKKLSVDMRIERQVFEGIQDPKSVVNLILIKLLTVESFGNLGLNRNELQEQLRASVRSARDFGQRVLSETRAPVIEKTEGVRKEIVSRAGETFSQVQETAQEKMTRLFGTLRSSFETSPPRRDE